MVTSDSSAEVEAMHRVNPLTFLVGLAVLFFGLLVLRAAFRQFGQGSCLTGCCLWELADSIIDLGCGMIGCGGVFAAIAIAISALAGRYRPPAGPAVTP